MLHARADQRGVDLDQRDGLSLHVRTHQGAVGIVMFKEGDQWRGDADDLLGRDVDVLDLVGGTMLRSPLRRASTCVTGDRPFGVEHVGGRQDGLHLLVGPEVLDLAGDLARFLTFLVGREDEAVLIDLGVDAERGDEADVGAFGRFDRADPP